MHYNIAILLSLGLGLPICFFYLQRPQSYVFGKSKRPFSSEVKLLRLRLKEAPPNFC